MSSDMIPEGLQLILLFVSWVVIAIVWHKYLRKYYLASLFAASSMVVLTQIAAYIELGYPDPYWLIASITGFFMGCVVALIVGLPFLKKRRVESEDI